MVNRGISTLAGLLWVLATLAGTGPLAGCSGGDGKDPAAPRAAGSAIDARIAGIWRLTNYIPEKELEPSALLALQTDKVLVRFEEGVLSSASTDLDFERRYRIEKVLDNQFTLLLEEEGGITHEVRCELDDNGNVSFQVLTEPWKGRGALAREGPATAGSP